jgi:hypothetical protein
MRFNYQASFRLEPRGAGGPARAVPIDGVKLAATPCAREPQMGG